MKNPVWMALVRVRAPLVWICASLVCGATAAHSQVPYALDDTPNITVRDRADVYLTRLSEAPDGRILVYASLDYVDDLPAGRLTWLNGDGSLHSVVSVTVANGDLLQAVADANGRILIGGTFTDVAGQPRPGLARLLIDGTLDATFVPDAHGFAVLRDFVPLADGGFVCIGWKFGATLETIALRYGADGKQISGYTPASVPAFATWAVGPNGEVAFTGFFPGGTRQEVRVFDGNGLLTTHGAALPWNFRSFDAVFEPDGSLVVGGQTFPGAGPALIRLTPAGQIDPSFSTSQPINNVSKLARLSDGRFVVLPAYPIPGSATLVHFSPSGVAQGSIVVEDFPGSYPINLELYELNGGDYLLAGRLMSVNGAIAPSIARISADREVRQDFRVDLQVKGSIAAIPEFAGGRLLAGAFTEVDIFAVGNLAAWTPTGTVSANVPLLNFSAERAFSTSDGGAVAIGPFSAVAGTTSANIVRIRPDGSVDTTFLSGISFFGFNDGVEVANGAIVLGGTFGAFVPNAPAKHLMRVLASGAIDSTFLGPGLPDAGGGIGAVTQDASGRLIVAGRFAAYQGTPRPGIARLSADGALDATFVPNVGVRGDGPLKHLTVRPNGEVYLVAVRSDAVSFMPSLIRYRADAIIDETFTAAAFGAQTLGAYAFTSDGGMFVVAADSIAGLNARVLRIDASGEVDVSFQCSLDNTPTTLALDASGRLWLAGPFTQVNGERREAFARMSPASFDAKIPGPEEITVPMFGSVTLEAVVTSPPGEVTLQWLRNGHKLPGATSAALVLNRMTPAKSGRYTVRVTADGETLVSNGVEVDVRPGQPVSR